MPPLFDFGLTLELLDITKEHSLSSIMRDLGIVELSSSPSPELVSSSRPRKRLLRTSAIDIIELSESDDDAPVAGPSHSAGTHEQIKVLDQHGASRSHVTPLNLLESRPGLPLFLPDPDEALPPPVSEFLISSSEPIGSSATQQFVPIPSSEPGSLIAEERDPLDVHIAQILEIIPDVLPEHVRKLVTRSSHQDRVVEQVLHTLFENPTYPKLDKKGKGKRRRDDEDNEAERERTRTKSKVDYESKERRREGGPNYSILSMV